jgi:hypothetical protein
MLGLGYVSDDFVRRGILTGNEDSPTSEASIDQAEHQRQ